VLQEVAMAPPDGTPRIRPAADFGTKGRAGEELHSGPRSLALSPDGHTLYVLNRFTRTVAVVDVREARAGKARVVRQLPVVPGRALDHVFREAGFEWRGAGCSMCLAMNTDRLHGDEVCASSSNRNFKGRQGSPTGRTLLMSPAMVAAAAVAGEVVDIRTWTPGSLEAR
jgi:hypothetical protein